RQVVWRLAQDIGNQSGLRIAAPEIPEHQDGDQPPDKEGDHARDQRESDDGLGSTHEKRLAGAGNRIIWRIPAWDTSIRPRCMMIAVPALGHALAEAVATAATTADRARSAEAATGAARPARSRARTGVEASRGGVQHREDAGASAADRGKGRCAGALEAAPSATGSPGGSRRSRRVASRTAHEHRCVPRVAIT